MIIYLFKVIKYQLEKKRRKSKNKSNKDEIEKLLNIKKEESRRPSFDLTFVN